MSGATGTASDVDGAPANARDERVHGNDHRSTIDRCGGANDAAPNARDAPDAVPGASGGTVHVLGVRERWDDDAFARWLDGLGVRRASARTRRGRGYGFVTFGDAMTRGRGGVVGEDGDAEDGRDVVARANARARRDIRDVITPMWRASYGEQLCAKKEIVAESLREITRGVRNACDKARKAGMAATCDWLRDALGRDKLCCEIEGIVRSPVLDGYRNKSEFTIGPSADGEITCGFNVGSFRDGVVAVAPPVGCRNISETAKYLGDATQTYLRERATAGEGLPVYDKRTATGFWRLFLCREGGTAPSSEHGWRHWLRPGTVMVMFQVRRSGYTEEQIREECDGARDAVLEAAAKATPPINVKVIVVQFYDGVSNVAPDDAEIRDMRTFETSEKSSDVIHERMCGLEFSLSATAFFQVNTLAAEALYRLAGEWASPNGKSLLLDVCCGTGTIGMTLAGNVKKVVGVDIVEESIKDAFVNAQLNGVTNTDWLAGKAEVVIPKVLREYNSRIRPVVDAPKIGTKRKATSNDPELSDGSDDEAAIQAAVTTIIDENEYEFDDVVAIVDPPRGGLHRSVLTALRREKRLKRLVYVSCNSSTMAKNVIDLCAPQGYDGNGGGAPFAPVKAIALDLFPHTAHVEAIVLLER
ncbi:S-adenosyl-L-methionine-dependent methyltransferase [Ostreococcus tauri]|uniref:S-adenosyl-L-methionine-dependent methyltransferase n=1 Tax=Ostreococcus tauri TaxID=70448 RepID=A0A1Y5I310_OSTTA|nr:S-adenosyl-L-methionine-dependent methyltransferase [Ostreococcus tauri]